MLGFGALWCEFLPPSAIAAHLPLLAEQGCALHMAWPSAATESHWALASAAEVAGVELRPWLLLPKDEGYWAGARNAEAFAAHARALSRAWLKKGLRPTTLLVDLEPAYHRMMAIEEAARRGRPLQAVRALARVPGAARVRAASGIYAALVAALHAEGWRAHLTTLPFLLDGSGVAEVLGLCGAEADWDRVSVQAYRTLFADAARGPLGGLGERLFGPRLVYSYARAARARFGARAGLDLGLVGEGVYPSLVYEGPADLAADVSAARAAGIAPQAINVFSLDGVLARGGAEWFVEASARRPKLDLGTGIARLGVRAGGSAYRLLNTLAKVSLRRR